AEQVRREEPIYGVSTGFGSNADKLLGAHPLRDELPGAKPSGRSPHAALQRNLVVTHAACVGEPMPAPAVRATVCIRINTLLRGELPGAKPAGRSLQTELQRNLVVTHAVCVGEPMPAPVVRAMMCIRINTLLRGHSGIRVDTLQAMTRLLNAGVVPVVPELG